DFCKSRNPRSLTGNIDGRGPTGTDTLDYSGYTADVHVNVTALDSPHGLAGGNGTTGIGGTFRHIDAFIGNGNTPPFNSSLCGPDIPNTWVINNTNAGTLDNVPFSGFNNLLGGAVSDVFNFMASGQITANVDGRGGGQNYGCPPQTKPPTPHPTR